MKKMTVYMGWDPREKIAYDVARYSILRRSSSPKSVQVLPLELNKPAIKDILTRPIEFKDGKLWCPISEAPMATEFAISRFCVPFLKNNGWALFCDCDILCLTDIKEIFDLADEKYAVMVVKHNHNPSETLKMDNQIQTTYSRKNWSSVILWNCGHPSNKKLTLENLNTWPGRDLHAFKWLNDDEIGELPPEWNFLVGVTPEIESPKILHYTLGGAWFKDWKINDYDKIWLSELAEMESK